jgi:hypothetical protein
MAPPEGTTLFPVPAIIVHDCTHRIARGLGETWQSEPPLAPACHLAAICRRLDGFDVS